MSVWIKRYKKVRHDKGLSMGAEPSIDEPIAPDLGIFTDHDAIAMRGVSAIQNENQKNNTDRAYSKKIFEFLEYCDHVYPHKPEAERYLVSFEHVNRFAWYFAYRCKRDRSSSLKRKSDDIDKKYLYFYATEFDQLVNQHTSADKNGTPPSEPTNGIGYSEIEQMKNAMRRLHREQVDNKTNNIGWEFVWTERVEEFKKMVKYRKQRMVSS